MTRANRRTPGRREPRKTAASRRAEQDAAAPKEKNVLHHPLYGRVPLVREYFMRLDGTRSTEFYLVADPKFRPPIPAAAVRGDLSKQEFCSMHHVPRYFYVDEDKVCTQCGEPFVFTAGEQKFWFETLRFHFSSTAVRCRRCRRQRRTERALNQQLGAAVELVERQPDDPVALVTLARTTAEFVASVGTGNLDRGIAAARRAQRLAPSLHEALYWEAACHELAGRTERATAVYDEFIASVRNQRRYRTMVERAGRRVERATT